MNKLKEKYYIALGNLQNMAIDNTKGSKGVDICVLDINEYVEYLQSKIDKANELIERKLSTETYQHLKKLYNDIDSTEEIWEDYEFEDLRDILKENRI